MGNPLQQQPPAIFQAPPPLAHHQAEIVQAPPAVPYIFDVPPAVVLLQLLHNHLLSPLLRMLCLIPLQSISLQRPACSSMKQIR
jgi:hypothetical protein